MAGLTRLSRRAVQSLEKLKRERPAAASQVAPTNVEPPPVLFLGRLETALSVADPTLIWTPEERADDDEHDTLTEPDRRTRAAEVALLQQDYDAEQLDSLTWPITAVAAGAGLVAVTDENNTLANHVLIGSRVAIDGSTANDDAYEVLAISWDEGTELSTVSLSRSLSDDTVDGAIAVFAGGQCHDQPGTVITKVDRVLQHRGAIGDTHVFARIGTQVIPLTCNAWIEGYLLEPCDPLSVDADGNLIPGCARMAVYDEREDWDDLDDDGNPAIKWERVSQETVSNRSISSSGQPGQYLVAYRLGRSWRPFFDCGQTRSIEHALEPEDLLNLDVWEPPPEEEEE